MNVISKFYHEPRTMNYSLIVASSQEDSVIGCGNALPWHLPHDWKRFKSLSMGKALIMGRRTFDSLKQEPLGGRLNIVLSRTPHKGGDNLVFVSCLEEALECGRRHAHEHGQDEVMVIGGENVYRQTITLASRIYLTVVEAGAVKGDAHFPPIPKDFEIISKKRVEEDQYPFTFVDYHKGSPPSLQHTS